MSRQTQSEPMVCDPKLTRLRQRLAAEIERVRAEGKETLQNYGDQTISEVTVAQAYGGMRGVKCMVTETSAVDPYEGIHFRGHSIPQLREKLPKAPGGEEPLPEGVFHLLLTGQIPTETEVAEITAAWRSREALPDHVSRTLDQLPVDTHPMTQFSVEIGRAHV